MLITSGCGISQTSWPDWPTWPKYCKITHNCNHLSIGAPAAGNWYIMNSTMKAITEAKEISCVIVAWTELNKLDLFVDQTNPIADLRNFNSRNWILDWQGDITNKNEGFWPSSVSTDNYFKQSYTPWQNKINHALTTFNCILTLEQFCKNRNIPLYNFMSYDLELEQFKQNTNTKWLIESINWDTWPTLLPLATDYYNGPWFKYEITKNQGLIPVAGWHWEIYQKYIIPILSNHYTQKNINLKKLDESVFALTEKKYYEYSNLLEN
jgi:hypothetical protein